MQNFENRFRAWAFEVQENPFPTTADALQRMVETFLAEQDQERDFAAAAAYLEREAQQ